MLTKATTKQRARMWLASQGGEWFLAVFQDLLNLKWQSNQYKIDGKNNNSGITKDTYIYLERWMNKRRLPAQGNSPIFKNKNL